MKSTRVPDRVHVVRPPENDSFPSNESRNTEIIRVLAKISDKLKRSEAERYELLAELREYRKSIRDLEEKSEESDKKYQTFEKKLKSGDTLDAETMQRQVRFENSLKATEDKMLKAIAGQAVIDKRLRDTEDKQTMIDQRLDQSVSEQAKLGRQVEIVMQDKARLMRKIERLEEIVLETQESLRAKAMVLLTDQSKEKSSLSAPSWSNVEEKAQPLKQKKIQKEAKAIDAEESDDWSKYVNAQTISTVALVMAALLFGWAISQLQKTETTANNPIATASINQEEATNNETAPLSGIAQDVAMNADPQVDNVLDYSDDQLLEALNNDPDQLAAQLNNIEPGAAEAQTEIPVPVNDNQPAITEPQITPEMENFEEIAFKQDPQIQAKVDAEKTSAPLRERITADSTLPDAVKPIEQQAFAGNAEAQHDLAAIYTAGHAGVNQNFDKAALWFREAADGEVANARYNLGVLYHQGLGKERDLSTALYWYREAARLGHAEAQYNLGIAHIEGIGTEYNPQLAAAFFERAANNGIMEAAYNLGLIHDNGLMGQSKPDEALLWYKIAADQGSKEAQAAMEQLATSLQIGIDDIDNLVDRMQLINESVKGRRAGPVESQNQTENQTDRDDTNARTNSRDTSQTAAIQNDNSLVTQVQEYLMLTGSYAGPADGINGPATRDAIRAYQAANSLPVNGEISEELLNSMVGGAIERLNQVN